MRAHQKRRTFVFVQMEGADSEVEAQRKDSEVRLLYAESDSESSLDLNNCFPLICSRGDLSDT